MNPNSSSFPVSELTPEEAFRKKASIHYLVCFIDSCPIHAECLRWLVGQHANPDLPSIVAINPRNPQMGNDRCPKFRASGLVTMKTGLKHLYEDMTHRMETAIRNALICQFGRKQYFEMRKGERLITPDDQAQIADICQEYGWNGAIVYDGEEENYDW